MRILSGPTVRLGNGNPAQRLDRLLHRRGAAATMLELVDIGQLAADGEHRIQRRARVLEHHADLGAADLAHRLLVEAQQVDAAEQDATRAAHETRRLDAKNRQGDDITLTWSPVPGATGYVLYRSTNPDGPFRWPEDFTTTVSSATYTDQNDDKKPSRDLTKILDPAKDYYYRITAVNAGGISPSATVHVKAK